MFTYDEHPTQEHTVCPNHEIYVVKQRSLKRNLYRKHQMEARTRYRKHQMEARTRAFLS